MSMTLKNTKTEILDELKKVSEENAKLRSMCSTGSEDTKKTAEKAVVAAAAVDVKNNIFSTEMNDKFTNLTEAIAIQEARLKELYGIEKELLDLTTVVNASKELQMQVEKQKNEFIAETEADKQKKLAEVAALITETKANHDALKKELAAQRKKDDEEYEYDLKRERKIEADEYADKKAARDKEDAEKAAELKAREEAVAAQEEEIQKMRDEIMGFDEKLKESYNNGYNDGDKAAGKEYGYKKNLADKEHEFEIRTRDSEIAALKKTVEEKTDKIAALETKLDAAYTQINALATSTVEASGSIKVLGNTASPK